MLWTIVKKYCKNCAYRIVNENNYFVESVGNEQSDKLIVLPYSSNKTKTITTSKEFKIISDLYNSLFYRNILDDYYITYLVKCPNSYKYPINSIIKDNCYRHLYEEIMFANYSKCIFFGDVGIYLSFCSPRRESCIYVNSNNILIAISYDLSLTKYKEKNDLIISQLSYIFNAYMYNDYSKLIIKRI